MDEAGERHHLDMSGAYQCLTDGSLEQASFSLPIVAFSLKRLHLSHCLPSCSGEINFAPYETKAGVAERK